MDLCSQVKHYFATGEHLVSPSLAEKWELIQRHCRLAVEEWGCEDQAIRSMRARLMAYSKGFPNSKMLREKFQHVSTLAEIDEIAAAHIPLVAQFAKPATWNYEPFECCRVLLSGVIRLGPRAALNADYRAVRIALPGRRSIPEPATLQAREASLCRRSKIRWTDIVSLGCVRRFDCR